MAPAPKLSSSPLNPRNLGFSSSIAGSKPTNLPKTLSYMISSSKPPKPSGIACAPSAT
jgi:hypothetical protein